MQSNKTAGRHAASKRRLRPAWKIAIGVLVLLLLVLVGFRLHSWLAQRDETRVIVLVNPWNDVDNSGFTPKLKTVEDIQVDSSCVDDLEQMLADCRATGCPITLTAGYRSREEQLMLFNNEVDKQMRAGFNADRAYSIAEQRVGAPGTSEHELGLAIDVQGASAQAWVRENSWRYGFILRYPTGSSDITGIIYEPWHYRYVGTEYAREIHERGITLEEFVALRRGR